MTVKNLADALSLTSLTGDDEAMARAVTGGYAGDLLSWVMGRAQADSCWFTIMSNINVAAVALLNDLACVVLCEGVTPDETLLARARQENLALFTSPLPSFALAGQAYALLAQS